MKGLVLCADDFALNEAVSRGIIQLGAQGRISATSVMVLSPRWTGDAALLRDLHGRIDIGLHLDWTSGFALQAGHGMSLGAAMLRAGLGGFARAAAREVIARQLDAFESAWGHAPDHVDGHQHVQQFAGIREALVDLLAQRYGCAPPYLRLSRVSAAQAGFKGRVITAMGAAALQSLARERGISCVGPLAGVYGFEGGEAAYAQRMAQWLRATPGGGMIMCHPAQGAQAGDEIGAARAWEFTYLAGDGFGQELREAGAVLVRGAALASAKNAVEAAA